MVILQPFEVLSPNNKNAPQIVEAETSNQLWGRSTFGSSFTLDYPLLGRDFVAGYLNGGTLFQLIRKEVVLEIQLSRSSLRESLSWTRLSAAELLARSPLPAEANVQLIREQRPRKLFVDSLERGFLIVRSTTRLAIPVAAIAEIILPAGQILQAKGRAN